MNKVAPKVVVIFTSIGQKFKVQVFRVRTRDLRVRVYGKSQSRKNIVVSPERRNLEEA